MDEAAAIRDDQPLAFDLTGGEPFLDFDLLLEVVAHGAKLDAEISCVTNAYWARTATVAEEKLNKLIVAGLTSLSISVSRFHQQFVPLHRAQLALECAARLGIPTELKGAVTNRDLEPGSALHEWQVVLDADKINIFPILPSLREGACLPESEYYREQGLPTQKCPGEVVCVYADGVARSCCGPGALGSFLALGDTTVTSLEEIHRQFLERGKQTILRELGPIHFAEHAIAAGLGHRLRDAYAGPCDLCGHISADTELRRVADLVASGIDAVKVPAPSAP
jgi:hypothetical protein